MWIISHPESFANFVNPSSKGSITKSKTSKRGYIGNLLRCINYVTLLIEDISNYDEVCLLCNIIEFAVFKIKDKKHCHLVSLEKITKT